jgi:hypothetical protein
VKEKMYIQINELMLAIPSSLSRSYSTFPLCSGTTLIEIAVYIIKSQGKDKVQKMQKNVSSKMSQMHGNKI